MHVCAYAMYVCAHECIDALIHACLHVSCQNIRTSSWSTCARHPLQHVQVPVYDYFLATPKSLTTG